MTREPLLTPEQARRELNVSRTTIYQLLWTKEIKASKIGRIWRISRTDLDKYRQSTSQ
ncbi:MAG: helix-turn-helix domain-containing protein [Armatimonadetes bacterium]|nr:helix-turn-helix domain-containing protein [Armatimonadota bacterium]